MAVKVEMEFKVDPFRELDRLKAGLKNKIIRIAINKAAAPVKAAVISFAPLGKGPLKKSIRIKVKHYRDRGVWVAIVGPGSSFKRVGKKFSRGKRKGQKRIIQPSRYASQVDGGTTRAKATPFRRPALQAAGPQYVRVMMDSLREQVAALLPS